MEIGITNLRFAKDKKANPRGLIRFSVTFFDELKRPAVTMDGLLYNPDGSVHCPTSWYAGRIPQKAGSILSEYREAIRACLLSQAANMVSQLPPPEPKPERAEKPKTITLTPVEV